MNKKDNQTALHYISSDGRRAEGYAEMIYNLILNEADSDIKDKVLWIELNWIEFEWNINK